MNRLKKRKHMAIWILLGVIVALAAATLLFINQPRFGRLPRGERLERVRLSPNYRDGAFHNRSLTPLFTSDESRFATMLGFLFRKQAGLRPDEAIPVVETDLRALPSERDAVVWFGHSSYLLVAGGKRYLIDPVFCTAAPLGFLNKPFEGTDRYRPEDMPDIDYLIITHDHWDHLDHQTVRCLRDRIGHVVCPLGVGEHFERWGFAPEQLIELDWDQDASLGGSSTVHCLPARHFSGRGLRSNQSLWASYLLQTPDRKVYIAGDGGYDSHFAQIGVRFPGIDLAIMENGQYNDSWRYIHLMPEKMSQAARDLGASAILTVHHSKYALARHRWDAPLDNEQQMLRDSLPVLTPQIGEVIYLGTTDQRR